LTELLLDGRAVIHPWVVGELALGNLGRERSRFLEDLQMLEQVPVVSDSEVLELVEARQLYASGIGWVDAHLLASALIAGASLWSFDLRLANLAFELGAGWIAG
jgi:hypothetical protein